MPGGYRKRRPEDYDRGLCLLPADVVDFLLATQPKEWEKLRQHHGADIKARFLNGIPIFTAELKNPLNGQDVQDAIRQYREDRDPREPLFGYGRCLAHFGQALKNFLFDDYMRRHRRAEELLKLQESKTTDPQRQWRLIQCAREPACGRGLSIRGIVVYPPLERGVTRGRRPRPDRAAPGGIDHGAFGVGGRGPAEVHPGGCRRSRRSRNGGRCGRRGGAFHATA